MSDNEYEFFCARKVDGILSQSEDKNHYILIYYKDSELGQV